MTWLYLALGIIFEVLGTVCMKFADGFTKLIPSVLAFLFYGLCLVFLTLIMKKMEVGVIYAVWASAGIVLIAVIGIIWFKESFTLMKAISILFIILGILGLELFD